MTKIIWEAEVSDEDWKKMDDKDMDSICDSLENLFGNLLYDILSHKDKVTT